MGVHHLLIAGVEYFAGKKGGVPSRLLASRVASRVKQGGVLSQKIAQLVSARPDIIVDADIMREFRSLQSLERSPGVHEASIAVVHIDGRNAIKRLRDPDVLREGSSLLRLLALASVASRVFPQMRVVCDALDTLLQELDLASELKKNELFRESLNGCEVTVVPETLSSCSDEVVMRYVPSVLAKDLASPADIETVNAFFRDIVVSSIRTGVLHLDLHSGNVGVSPDGRHIVVYDMGSVRQVDRSLTCSACVSVAGALEHLWLEDWGALADHLVRKRIVTSVNNVDNLKIMVSVASAYAEGSATYVDVGKSMQVVRGDVNLDASIFQLVQSMSILEGCCKVLNPKFNMNAALRGGGLFMDFVEIIENAESL
jgi:predicted unusual protein kinase regulating ubiquinone biosynthesis (AarF/ABC1/UbiB family)